MDIQFGEYFSRGILSNPNKDIYCGGTKDICTVPTWRAGKDYALGKKGVISNTAPLKDTVVIPAGGYVVGYLLPDNPGYWLLHCHINDHLLEGMSVIVSESVDHLNKSPEGMKQCGNFEWNVESYFNTIRY